MNKYVVGFLFDDLLQSVCMISKNRPTWQAGKLNGVGGKVEAGEYADQAMAREFQEETGVVTHPNNWVHVLTLRFPYAEIDIFACKSSALLENVSTTTDEVVGVYNIYNHCRFLCQDSLPFDVIENIPSLLDLSIQRLTDREL